MGTELQVEKTQRAPDGWGQGYPAQQYESPNALNVYLKRTRG